MLKRHVRTNKDEPLQANPQYGHVRYADGRETTVSLNHLAPLPEDTFHPNNILPEPNIQVDSYSLPCYEPLNDDISGAPPQETPTIPDTEDTCHFNVQCVTGNPLIDLVFRPGVNDVMLEPHHYSHLFAFVNLV